jgi:hypothetical protein
MRGVKQACESLVADLKSAGYAGSSIDPEQLNPPGAVWVQPRTIHDLTLGGGGTLTVWCYLLAGNYETGDAMALLDDGLEGLLELIDDSDDLSFADTDEPIDLGAAVLLPGYQTPMPAYRLALDFEL